jgi:hypothetical protein
MRSPRSSRPDGSQHSAEIFLATGTQRCHQRWESPRNTVVTRRVCSRRAAAPSPGSLVPRPETLPTAALSSSPGAVHPHREHGLAILQSSRRPRPWPVPSRPIEHEDVAPSATTLGFRSRAAACSKHHFARKTEASSPGFPTLNAQAKAIRSNVAADCCAYRLARLPSRRRTPFRLDRKDRVPLALRARDFANKPRSRARPPSSTAHRPPMA